MAANLVTKLYLPALADFDAERLSRWLGTSAGEEVAWSRAWGSAGTRAGEHRRAISMPLARPEALRGGGGPDEILVRFANLPPAWLWSPAYYLRPEYHDRILESRITTADLSVYHHLWTLRGRPGTPTSRDTEAAAGGVARVAAPQSPGWEESPKPVPDPAPEPSTPSPHAPAEAGAPAGPAPDSVDDVRRLNQIMETLVLRARHDAHLAVRVVHNRGRLVEVRVRPDIMLEVCRGADGMHALARRWSALRWVRRVRPTFVLSRRALDMLDPRLRATLKEACGLESTLGPSPGGRGGP